MEAQDDDGRDKFWEQFLTPDWLSAFSTAALALLTAVLAIFAYFAWQESRKTTATLQAQLETLQKQQEALIAFRIDGQPKLNENGIVSWNIWVINIGRSADYNDVIHTYISVGDQKLQPSNTWGLSGPIMDLPGDPTYITIYSRPGISQEWFDKMMNTEGGIAFMIEFDFRVSEDGPHRKEAFCVMRQANGVTRNVPVTGCDKAL